MLPTQSDANEMLREDQRRRRQETTMTGMTRDEASVRAQEALAGEWPECAEAIRAGSWNYSDTRKAIVRALLDAHKPLSEIVPPPPVDPDVLLAREICARKWAERNWNESVRDLPSGRLDRMPEMVFAIECIRAARAGAA